MIKIYKKILTFALITSFVFVQTSFAEEIISDTVDAPSGTAVSTESVAPVSNELVIQDAFNLQTGISGDTLENTTNPETATSTGGSIVSTSPAESDTSTTEGGDTSVVISDSANSEEETNQENIVIAGPAFLEVVEEDITAEISTEPVIIDLIEVNELDTQPIVATIVESQPEPDFEFVLTGKQIATKKKISTSDGVREEEEVITTDLTPVIDNANGTMNISGACSDAYFVVLLFKNAMDYDTDPRSYILNKAYPCVDGAFAYSISALPSNLVDGTYYLLVGQQGERGAWTPITGLTEITINNNQ